MIVKAFIDGTKSIDLESIPDHSEILKAIEEGRMSIQPTYVIRNGKKRIIEISLTPNGYLAAFGPEPEKELRTL